MKPPGGSNALGDAVITSSTLWELIKKTTSAIEIADRFAKRKREIYYDPAITPDPHEEEQLAQWQARYEVLKPEHNVLAVEFCELYPSVVSRLVDLLQPIDTHKRALSDLHQSRPLDVTLRLLEAELVARNLEGFTRGAFDDGARTIGATPRIGRQRRGGERSAR